MGTPQKRQIMISTGGSPFSYSVVDTVIAFHSEQASAFKGTDITGAMRKVNDALEKQPRRSARTRFCGLITRPPTRHRFLISLPPARLLFSPEKPIS